MEPPKGPPRVSRSIYRVSVTQEHHKKNANHLQNWPRSAQWPFLFVIHWRDSSMHSSSELVRNVSKPQVHCCFVTQSLQCFSHSPGSCGIRMAPGCTKLQPQGMLRGPRGGTTGGAPVPSSPTHCCFHRDGPQGAVSPPPPAMSSCSVCRRQAGRSAGELNEQLKWQRLAVMIFPTDPTTPLLTSASEPKSLHYSAQSSHPTLPT